MSGCVPAPSKGFAICVSKLEPCGRDDRRIIVLEVLPSRRLRLDRDDLSLRDLPHRLEGDPQSVPRADPNLPFREIAAIIDAARTRADYISIVTPTVGNGSQWWTGACLNANLPLPVMDGSKGLGRHP